MPQYQRRGIGTRLIKSIMKKYNSVYQMELLTEVGFVPCQGR